MRWIAYGIVAALTAVVGGALWYSFSDPVFIGKLGTYAITTIVPIIVGAILKVKTPEEYREINDEYLEGNILASKHRPHPGEH